jgi:hypothetical protein
MPRRSDKERTAQKKRDALQALDAAKKLLEEARKEEQAIALEERRAWEAEVGARATRAGLQAVPLDELAQLFAWAAQARSAQGPQVPWGDAVATPVIGKQSSHAAGPQDEAQAAD